MTCLRLALLIGVLLPSPIDGLAQTSSSIHLSPRELHTFGQVESVPTSPTFLPGTLIGTIASSTIIKNNLGGMGPLTSDEHVIILKDAGIVGSEPITIKLSNLSSYEPTDASAVIRNGRSADGTSAFGVLNMKCNTSTRLKLSFHKWVGEVMVPVKIENVQVTFVDIDSGHDVKVREYFGAMEPDTIHLYDPTELANHSAADWSGPAWISTTTGNGSDNPSDPMNLTPAEKARAVGLGFVNVSSVDALFGLTHHRRCNGRNLLFALTSNLAPTPSPTPSPTKTLPPTSSPTPSPTTQLSEETCGTCVIWGDPHIITFKAHQRRFAQHPRREEFFRTRGWKSDQVNINEAGRFWLVKSGNVRIQGRYIKNETSGRTSLASLIVGGPFLEGKVLTIRPMNGKTTWEGTEILPSIPSVFKNELVHATYHNAAKLVKDGTVGPGIDVALPLGVTLTVNRWRDMLAAEISMCQIEEQSGQCGSYAEESY